MVGNGGEVIKRIVWEMIAQSPGWAHGGELTELHGGAASHLKL